jgi:hypothetical protein
MAHPNPHKSAAERQAAQIESGLSEFGRHMQIHSSSNKSERTSRKFGGRCTHLAPEKLQWLEVEIKSEKWDQLSRRKRKHDVFRARNGMGKSHFPVASVSGGIVQVPCQLTALDCPLALIIGVRWSQDLAREYLQASFRK